MRQKKWQTPKTAGNELENLVKQKLIEAKIPFKQETTVNSTKQRTKGSVDFILENPEGYIECKRFTTRVEYSFKAENRDIKWSQIEFLHKKHLEGHFAGFIFQETHDKRLIFVHIRDFVIQWINTSAKSMNVKQALIIGREITDFKFLNVDTSNDVKGGRNE